MRIETPETLRGSLVAQHRAMRRVMECTHGELTRGDNTLARSSGISLVAGRVSEMAAMDLVLGPILRAIDAWGPQRERSLYLGHSRQVAELGQVDALLRDPAVPVDAPLAAFLIALGNDLRREEDEFLSPTLLRDDPVVLDSFGG
jgi:hypothetical protein